MKRFFLLFAVFCMMVSCKKEIEKPTVSTKYVESFAETSAVLRGVVIDDGGGEVISRGFCYGDDAAPTIDGGLTAGSGNGIGSFECIVEDLCPNTTYYVRAYAINEAGVSYGEDKTFTTLKEKKLPTITTRKARDITSESAVSGGEVTDDGNCEVTVRGVCWSTDQNPTTDDNKTVDGSGTGSFTSNLTNLEPQTTYYVRAYATNEVGTAYGSQYVFETEETINGYEYVDLGLPSGLKWAKFNVGANNPEDYGNYYAWGETETKAEYTSDNCDTYGLSISDLQTQGIIDENGNLTPSYDAATANWGGTWRLPKKYESEELKNNCTWTLTWQNHVRGYRVTGPNGNSIFLPAAGDRLGSSLNSDGYFGCYWSSTRDEGNSDAYRLIFGPGGQSVSGHLRFYGCTVRPVSE